MPSFYNDSPIELAADDRYGVGTFAQAVAQSILNIKEPVGTTIALNGPWGSGKSSAVNLIRSELKAANDETLVVTEFKCWWYRGEEALALAFLQNLHTVLKSTLGDKIKDYIPHITQNLLLAGPVIGQAVSLASGQPWAAGLISGTSKFVSTFFPKGETVEKNFLKLAEALRSSGQRFLVIIDDIDRLSPDEALAVFRLLKSVGHLPNVLYLVVFDRELADKAVEERFPSEGPHYLEKIIQAGFELPTPLQTDLNEAVIASINEICTPPDDSDNTRFGNLFYDAVVPYVITPRHVTRFRNAISVTWPAIKNEVNVADFVALETLRLYEPTLFKTIRANKAAFCGVRGGREDGRDEGRFEKYLAGVPVGRREQAKGALERLFPRLENVGYGAEWMQTWDAERRVCVEKHFDTYFRLSLSDETLSAAEIGELIERADDREFVQKVFREASMAERRNHKSRVPVYLDVLTSNALKVDKSKVEPLLAALFEIHDEIDLERDRDTGFYAMGNTTLRYHWLIRRLTKGRFSLADRTAVYLEAIKQAPLGWMVDFASSVKRAYSEDESRRQSEENCLVSEDAVPAIVERALALVRDAAADRSLLSHRQLIYILYRWRDYAGGPAEVLAWTATLMDDDAALVILAKTLTGQSWSHSAGDRVAKSNTIVQIDDNVDIIDSVVFRTELERVRAEGKIDAASLAIVETFIAAWDRPDREGF